MYTSDHTYQPVVSELEVLSLMLTKDRRGRRLELYFAATVLAYGATLS